MCPCCQQEMARLSNIVRELTQGLGSSCEIAKALVDVTNLPSLVHSQQTESGLIAIQIGAAADGGEANFRAFAAVSSSSSFRHQ